jgi:hypothetical protein
LAIPLYIHIYIYIYILPKKQQQQQQQQQQQNLSIMSFNTDATQPPKQTAHTVPAPPLLKQSVLPPMSRPFLPPMSNSNNNNNNNNGTPSLRPNAPGQLPLPHRGPAMRKGHGLKIPLKEETPFSNFSKYV